MDGCALAPALASANSRVASAASGSRTEAPDPFLGIRIRLPYIRQGQGFLVE